MIESWGLRLRFFLFFAAMAVGGIVVLSLSLWFGFSKSGGPVDGYVIAGVIAGFGLIGLSAWIGLLFDENVAKPILALSSELHTRANSNVISDIDLNSARYLGALAPAAQAIQDALEETRSSLERNLTDRMRLIGLDKKKLEILLKEMADILIVISADGRVLLYNRAAAVSLNNIGLNKPLTSFIHMEPVIDAVNRLETMHEEDDRQTEVFHTDTIDGKWQLNGQVANILLEEGRLGHALSLRATETGQGKNRLSVNRNGRGNPSEFYDFRLLAGSDEELMDRPLSELSFVVFDTETTGLDRNTDEVVQIAGVRVLMSRLLRGETFDHLVNPGRSIPSLTTEIHGITDDMVADAPAFAEVAEEFDHFAEGSVLVAHNAAFDMAFFERLKQSGGPAIEHPALCTAKLSSRLFPHTGDHTLDGLADRFGITIPEEDRHTALGDSIATAEALLRMLPLLEARGIYTLRDAIAFEQ